MPVTRIERIVGGAVRGRVERGSMGSSHVTTSVRMLPRPVSRVSMTWRTFCGRVLAAECA
jgi:hypothetical protein